MDRPMRLIWVFGAVLAVLLVLVGSVTGAVGSDGGPTAAQSAFDLAQTQVDPDAVLLSADIQADGTASWVVEYRVRLDDENSTTAFRELSADIDANGTAYVSRFSDRMAATLQDASAATGRDMRLRNVSVSTSTQELPQTYGVLRYTFVWTQFAVVDGDQIRAGDALVGMFLDADSALLLSWPNEYTLVEASPSPTETREASVLWRGPTDFGPDEPSLVVSRSAGPGGLNTSILGLVVIATVFLGGGAFWWWRARSTGRPGDQTGPTPADQRPPDDLLSNEERVIALLEEHGGRMKQQEVVESLGWTDAKTSQVVGQLREDGRIEGFRLGRENVLRLPEEDEALDSEDGAP